MELEHHAGRIAGGAQPEDVARADRACPCHGKVVQEGPAVAPRVLHREPPGGAAHTSVERIDDGERDPDETGRPGADPDLVAHRAEIEAPAIQCATEYGEG